MKTYKELREEVVATTPPKLVRPSPNINFLVRAARDRNSPLNPLRGGRGRPNP